MEIKDEKLRGKLERIDEMWKLGFNVPDYHLVQDEESLEKLKNEIFPKYERMSLRTYSKTDELKEFKCPHHPNWPIESQMSTSEDQESVIGLLDFVDEYAEKYYVMVSPPINPAECLYAGNMVVPGYDEENVICEYIVGPGTVRDVETRGKSVVFKRRGPCIIDGSEIRELTTVRNQVMLFPKEKTIIEWRW